MRENNLTLIDTGSSLPSAAPFIKILTDHLQSTQGVIRNIILTHHHLDHIGGLEHLLVALNHQGLPEPRIYKFKVPAGADLRWDRPLIPDEQLDEIVRKLSASGNGIHWLTDGATVVVQEEQGEQTPSTSTTLKVVHTPGHTADSISLLLQETNEVFVADTVLG